MNTKASRVHSTLLLPSRGAGKAKGGAHPLLVDVVNKMPGRLKEVVNTQFILVLGILGASCLYTVDLNLPALSTFLEWNSVSYRRILGSNKFLVQCRWLVFESRLTR